MTSHQYGISALVTQTPFCEGSSGDLAKRRLFSQATRKPHRMQSRYPLGPHSTLGSGPEHLLLCNTVRYFTSGYLKPRISRRHPSFKSNLHPLRQFSHIFTSRYLESPSRKFKTAFNTEEIQLGKLKIIFVFLIFLVSKRAKRNTGERTEGEGEGDKKKIPSPFPLNLSPQSAQCV